MKDILFLFLAWCVITRNECPPTPYNQQVFKEAYQWWWEDLNRAKYLERMGKMSGLMHPLEVAPWTFPQRTDLDTVDNLTGIVYLLKLRWRGTPPPN